jgi:hypothetical protein
LKVEALGFIKVERMAENGRRLDLEWEVGRH